MAVMSRALVAVGLFQQLLSVAATAEGACANGAAACAIASDDRGAGGAGSAAAVELLQTQSARHQAPASGEPGDVFVAAQEAGKGKDLVLQHIPFNFGHTVEKVAFAGNGVQAFATYAVAQGMATAGSSEAELHKSMQRGGELWGHMHPELQAASDVTGCPMFYTPGKYWPKDLADKYFGNKTSFGMLRDPYERLVALFRGDISGYGGSYPEFFKTCDVDGAVRHMMEEHLKPGADLFREGCTFVPQAEFFEAPYGIQYAVDNRRFPDSANEMFAEHGSSMHIETEDIIHVSGCPEAWAGDLSCETKAMVKQVYKRDFDLLCEHFGYCDEDENCCIKGVPMMCPKNVEERQKTATHCK